MAEFIGEEDKFIVTQWSVSTTTNRTDSICPGQSSYSFGKSSGEQRTVGRVREHAVKPEELLRLTPHTLLVPCFREVAPVPGLDSDVSLDGLPDGRMVTMVTDPAIVGRARVACITQKMIPRYDTRAILQAVDAYQRHPRGRQ
jgi:hypothetical protein